jgi:hypothetical protein
MRDDRSTAAALVAMIADRPVGHVPLILRADTARIQARLLALDGVGSPYHLAVALLDQAEYLRGSDPSASASLAAEAASLFERLRVEPLLARAAAISASSTASAVAD